MELWVVIFVLNLTSVFSVPLMLIPVYMLIDYYISTPALLPADKVLFTEVRYESDVYYRMVGSTLMIFGFMVFNWLLDFIPAAGYINTYTQTGTFDIWSQLNTFLVLFIWDSLVNIFLFIVVFSLNTGWETP